MYHRYKVNDTHWPIFLSEHFENDVSTSSDSVRLTELFAGRCATPEGYEHGRLPVLHCLEQDTTK